MCGLWQQYNTIFNICVSWSTSEIRGRLAPWNHFKPSSKIFLLTVPRWYFFFGSFVLFMYCVLHASRLFIAAVWPHAGKWLTSWLLFVIFNCVFVTFQCGILGQVWYLIVSILDLCRLSYFAFKVAMLWGLQAVSLQYYDDYVYTFVCILRICISTRNNIFCYFSLKIGSSF